MKTCCRDLRSFLFAQGAAPGSRALRILLSAVAAVLLAAFVLGGPGSSAAQAQTVGGATREFGNIVVFAQFADNDGTFMTDPSKVARIVAQFDPNSTSPRSLAGYLNAVSFGQFHANSYLPQYDATTQTITPVTLDRTYASYAAENSSYILMRDIIAKLNIPNSSDYDMNDDGVLDNVTFIIDGDSSDRDSILYSHKEDYQANGWGIFISTINVISSGAVFDSLTGMGVINHEFMHSIGYPDLYKENSADGYPVGRWDLMATTSNFMQYPLTYLRSTEYAESPGWLTIDTVTQSTQGLELVPTSEANGNQAFILKSPLSSSEFFVVEFRKQAPNVLDPSQPGANALDTKIPGSGLIVYRVNTLVERLNNRTSPINGIYVFRDQDTGYAIDGLGASFYSAESGRTHIGTTDMTATEGALTFNNDSNSGIAITNIGSAAGGTITFDVEFADTTNLGLWGTVGDSDVSGISTSDIAGTVDGSTVYVVHQGANPGELVVSKSIEGGAWEQVGATITSFGGSPDIAVYGGVPYLAFCDLSFEATVLYRYDGSGWVKVATISDNSSTTVRLAAAEDGLYAAFTTLDTGWTNTLNLARFGADGSRSDLYSGHPEGAFQLSLSGRGSTVCLSARTVANVPIIVTCMNGSVSDVGAPDVACTASSIVVAADGFYVALNGPQGLTVWSCIGGVYNQVGPALTVKPAASASLVVLGSTPYVLLSSQDDGSAGNTVVMTLVDGQWVQEGLAVDSSRASDAVLLVGEDCLYAVLASQRAVYDSYPVVKTHEAQTNVPGGDVPLTTYVVRASAGTVYAVGDACLLSASVLDAAGVAVTEGITFSWECSDPGQPDAGWLPMGEGAGGRSFELTVTEQGLGYVYRCAVTAADGGVSYSASLTIALSDVVVHGSVAESAA